MGYKFLQLVKLWRQKLIATQQNFLTTPCQLHLTSKEWCNDFVGSVLNIDCNTMLYSMSDFAKGSFRNLVDPDKSFWSNPSTTGRAVFMQFIRLFYIVGPPEPVQIGMFTVCATCICL